MFDPAGGGKSQQAEPGPSGRFEKASAGRLPPREIGQTSADAQAADEQCQWISRPAMEIAGLPDADADRLDVGGRAGL